MAERRWENSCLGKPDDLPFSAYLLPFYICHWVSYVPVKGAKRDLLHWYKMVVKISLDTLLLCSYNAIFPLC